MTRRNVLRHSQLTSLVDVLFILLFASLVQQRRAAEASTADTTAPEPATVTDTVDAGAPDATPPPADPHASARAVADQLETDTVVLVALDDAGTVTSIERGGHRQAADLPLLRATVDHRVVVYAAADNPALRLCRVVADALGGDIRGALILVSTYRELRGLPYALVRGLRADTARCIDDAGAYALVVRAADLPSAP